MNGVTNPNRQEEGEEESMETIRKLTIKMLTKGNCRGRAGKAQIPSQLSY